jgi:hypothetical protein
VDRQVWLLLSKLHTQYDVPVDDVEFITKSSKEEEYKERYKDAFERLQHFDTKQGELQNNIVFLQANPQFQQQPEFLKRIQEQKSELETLGKFQIFLKAAMKYQTLMREKEQIKLELDDLYSSKKALLLKLADCNIFIKQSAEFVMF